MQVKLTQLAPNPMPAFIKWLNWSAMKRRILIGSPRGPNFVLRTAKMERSQNNFGIFLFQFIAQNRQFSRFTEIFISSFLKDTRV